MAWLSGVSCAPVFAMKFRKPENGLAKMIIHSLEITK